MSDKSENGTNEDGMHAFGVLVSSSFSIRACFGFRISNFGFGLRCLLIAAGIASARAEVRVPAFTAYTLPDPDGVSISTDHGTARWTDPALSVNWYGRFARTGEVAAALDLRLPPGVVSALRMTVNGRAHEVRAVGREDGTAVADFGSFRVDHAGYQRFALASLNAPGRPFGDLEALRLNGPAVENAHFNLLPRRNAASVHLAYRAPPDADIRWFFAEVTAVTDPIHTFYMACGFHRGYFGMQVNRATERRIIFSVWDSGGEADHRDKVAAEDRVQLIAKGDGVYAGDFGHEGTGGHSHLKYLWKTGEPQRFLLGAQPVDASHTVYAGYYWHPERKSWTLIAAMKAPREGGGLRGLHSFSENFGGSTGHLLRKARFGRQWARTAEGEWIEITEAGFSHDETGRADRLDRFMGVEDGQFFLSHGGFVEGCTRYGERFARPPSSLPRPDGALPEIPVAPARNTDFPQERK